MAHVVEDDGNWEPKIRMNNYPWDEWLDGRLWSLTRRDYGNNLPLFRGNIYYQASQRGLKVLTRTGKDGDLMIKAVPMPQDPSEPSVP